MAIKKNTASKATSSKKSSAKKAKPDGDRVLVCAHGEECFWTTDGRILTNLLELRDALEGMSQEIFSHHVTKDKNDFANWVEDILSDHELGASLRRAKKPATAHTVVVRRLKVYER